MNKLLRSIGKFKYLFYLLLAFSVTIPVAFCDQSVADIDLRLNEMFEYAKTHNLIALNKMQGEIDKSSNSTLRIGYPLALYIADPIKYESLFVNKFPNDASGIMHDLYVNIELKNHTPNFLFSMEALGEIALKGDDNAIYKVLIGIANSDGVVSEVFCDYAIKSIQLNIKKTLTALSHLETSERDQVYICFNLMTSADVLSLNRKISKIDVSGQHVKQITKEISRKVKGIAPAKKTGNQ